MDEVFCAITVLLAAAIVMLYWDILRRGGLAAEDTTQAAKASD